MLHEPAGYSGKDPAAPYKARLGIYMFLLYGMIYAGFVLINIFNPLLMERNIFLGLNLAVVYGFSLIILALVFALVYNVLCSKKEKGSL
jgi:uncharacterized membrane protein (DUF485 family)